MRPGIEGVIEGNFADWLNDAFRGVGQAPLAPYNDPRIVIDDFTAPSICLLDDFDPDFDKACEQFDNNRYWQADLRTAYDISDTLQVSSVTGVAKLDHDASVDYQLLGTEDRSTDLKSLVFYQELQLNAELFGGAVDLVTGLNYFYEKSESPALTINRRGTSAFPNRANGNADAGLFRLNDAYTEQVSNSYGVFVSGTWHATDRLNLTGGLRFAYDKKDFSETEHASANFTPAPGTTFTHVTSDDSWNQIDWRATVDYDLAEDVMAYATASKAYKAGQFSFTALDRIPGPDQSGDFIQTIAPETVKNYEAGMRVSMFDRRLRFNPTLFYMQWTNRQAARQVACVTSPSCPLGFEIQVVNSGDVDIYGGELDMQLAVTDEFILDAAGAITQYDLKDEVANSGPNLYPDVPEITFNIGATYNTIIDAGELTLNLNYSYTDEQATHPTNGTDSSFTLPAIELVNARIQFVPEGSPVRISAFANNLLDNTYATYGQRFGGGYWDQGGPPARLHPLARPDRSALAVVRGRPRELGVTLQYDF
ncbi:TonB-dependent receptor [Croceibacterium soli]|uniref:TonB-dependent receptor n=1 Tax=Croceibacterium soli TaxID=1739690 RepID=UPI001F1617CE|nr:TonB-dependent receptor [Croceibacterium soli]